MKFSQNVLGELLRGLLKDHDQVEVFDHRGSQLYHVYDCKTIGVSVFGNELSLTVSGKPVHTFALQGRSFGKQQDIIHIYDDQEIPAVSFEFTSTDFN